MITFVGRKSKRRSKRKRDAESAPAIVASPARSLADVADRVAPAMTSSPAWAEIDAEECHWGDAESSMSITATDALYSDAESSMSITATDAPYSPQSPPHEATYSPTGHEEDARGREIGSEGEGEPAGERSESEDEKERESEIEDAEDREGRTLLAHALHVLDSTDSDRRLLVLAIHRLLAADDDA